ncbi:MAG TPA: isochorismate synthase [Gemmatimonadaceae bacterium]|nr:isochorismate synthase [Gemmatimonadaceae bacterium]
MITSPTERLAARVADAGARARATGRPVLVSVGARVPSADPLDVLDAVSRASASDTTLAALAAPGMYWTRPADEFALAGFGAIATFAHAGADRFTAIDREWSALVDDALVDDPSGGAAGVGPALVGGFAFDPDGPRSELWRGFSSADLVLPRLLLAVTGGERWLTTSVVVGPDGCPDVPLATLTRLRARLLDVPARGDGAAAPGNGTLTMVDARSADAWRALVAAAVDAIRAGTMEKVVLAREVRARASREIDVVATLRELRATHPRCYVFGYWRGDRAFVGASPERLVRVDGREVRASSLAGSARRGAARDADAAHATRLLASAKERVEHEVVRRALCASLAELCDDVTTATGPSLLSLPHVHHLHTAVRARLRGGHSLLDLLARLHPTPAVGGAPRDVALQFIRAHEELDRGWYAAPVGWLQRDRGEFAVALRSALVRGTDASLFAGCGVVGDSDPEREYAESLLKLVPMQQALGAAIAAAGAGRPPVAAPILEGAR